MMSQFFPESQLRKWGFNRSSSFWDDALALYERLDGVGRSRRVKLAGSVFVAMRERGRFITKEHFCRRVNVSVPSLRLMERVINAARYEESAKVEVVRCSSV